MRHDFETRFGISIGEEEAQTRFVNRVHNAILDDYHAYKEGSASLRKSAAMYLGEKFHSRWDPATYAGKDFLRTLKAVEAIYHARRAYYPDRSKDLEAQLRVFLESSEVDLGIEFRGGSFFRTGAPLLDRTLVVDPLEWCRSKGHTSVVAPFEKALSHLLEARSKPARAADAITDAYDAVEALGKLASGRDSDDLSKSRQSLVSALGLGEAFGDLMKGFIKWGNLYRHAEGVTTPRKRADYDEAEAFVYQAGVFIRLWSQRKP